MELLLWFILSSMIAIYVVLVHHSVSLLLFVLPVLPAFETVHWRI